MILRYHLFYCNLNYQENLLTTINNHDIIQAVKGGKLL